MHRSAQRRSGAEQIAQRDTIAAISTPAGEGAIALVRLSGENAVGVADTVFRGREKPSAFVSHTQHLGEIVDGDRVVDQVMIALHRAPASYTGEDVVEISCHGGMLVTARVLEACLRAGARAAEAGELTERAFLNGKMDLTQAEAVIDLIRARTDLSLRAAHEQLEGRLGHAVKAIHRAIVDLLAQIDASIDFPEEGIAPEQGEALRERLRAIERQIAELLATAERGRILREGVRVVISGPTNAGKSSLLNRLLGYERAIVSAAHGTTRDTIEEAINVRGVPVRLLDTAGLREATDEVEQAGMARTQQSLSRADLVLHLFDASEPRPHDLHLPEVEVPVLLILNKADLPEHPDWRGVEALRICALADEAASVVEEAILQKIARGQAAAESGIAINVRHRDCLQRALDACARAAETMEQGLASEYAAVDLRIALAAVAEILGTKEDEAVRDAIFAQFCIGK